MFVHSVGELEEWHPTDILMPNAMVYGSTWEKMLGLVNGLLIAYLVRKTTGKQWERARSGFPDWKEGKLFSVSMTIGGTAQPSPDDDGRSTTSA